MWLTLEQHTTKDGKVQRQRSERPLGVRASSYQTPSSARRQPEVSHQFFLSTDGTRTRSPGWSLESGQRVHRGEARESTGLLILIIIIIINVQSDRHLCLNHVRLLWRKLTADYQNRSRLTFWRATGWLIVTSAAISVRFHAKAPKLSLSPKYIFFHLSEHFNDVYSTLCWDSWVGLLNISPSD